MLRLSTIRLSITEFLRLIQARESLPSPHAKTYTEVFSDWLVDIARKDPGVIAITPAMKEGSGLVAFAKEFPNRFFDVAIAEQHAATFAAGLAAEGLKPVCTFYSTFSQRAFDQIVHDVAIPGSFGSVPAGSWWFSGCGRCNAPRIV